MDLFIIKPVNIRDPWLKLNVCHLIVPFEYGVFVAIHACQPN